MGLKSKINGLQFEQMIQNRANRDGVLFIKIPDGCRRLPGRFQRIIPVTTPFDFVFISEGVSVFADAKSFDKSQISYSMLTSHQVTALNNITRYKAKAGYLVFHRDCDQVRFYSAEKLYILRPRESVKLTDGILLGASESFNLNLLF